MWRQARLTQTVETNQLRHFIQLCHLVTLSVSEIIWCWWQKSKWLWCIGSLILTTDSWSTETDLSNCYTTTINTRLTDQRMNTTLCTERLLPDCLSSLLFCVLFIFMALIEDHKSCLTTHKLIPKIITDVGLPLAQLFSVHSLRMHMGQNALHYHSHTALRNWWLCLGYI
jgi:hypothetical protein